MKTTYTIAAIAMFAVILGMSALAPAMAAPAPKVDICHFAEEEIIFDGDGNPIGSIDAHWKILNVSQNGADNGHVGNHGDDTGEDFIISDAADETLCRDKPNFQENDDDG